MRHFIRAGCLLIACAVLAVAAEAATISLGARTSYFYFTSPPPASLDYYLCGFNGIVSFSGTPNLMRVDCFVDGAITASGSQGTAM